MHKLSDRAEQKRKEDMESIAINVTTMQYLRIILVGGVLLILNMTKKLTPGQRGLLAFITVTLAGSLIALLIVNGWYGFALVIMFALGVAVAEIARL